MEKTNSISVVLSEPQARRRTRIPANSICSSQRKRILRLRACGTPLRMTEKMEKANSISVVLSKPQARRRTHISPEFHTQNRIPM